MAELHVAGPDWSLPQIVPDDRMPKDCFGFVGATFLEGRDAQCFDCGRPGVEHVFVYRVRGDHADQAGFLCPR